MATVLTNTGEAQWIDAVDAFWTTPFVGWGTGVATAVKGDTTLGAESADESRTATTTSQPSADVLRNVGTITCLTSSKAITESGMLDASSVGNMYTRADFAAINVDPSDAIEFTWDIEQT